MPQPWGYVISPQELLYIKKVLIYRGAANHDGSPKTIKRSDNNYKAQQPSPYTFADNDNSFRESIRLAARIFLFGSATLTIINKTCWKIYGPSKLQTWQRSLNTRIPFSLSLFILLHRFFHRVISRLQSKIPCPPNDSLSDPLRKLGRLVMSPLASSATVALSGIALGAIPSETTRLYISAYVFAKVMEYLSNAVCASNKSPWWFGSWLLFPLSSAQLFHALLTGQDAIPFIYRKALMTFPTENKSKIGVSDTTSMGTPVVEMCLAATLGFPTFHSSILFPQKSLNQRSMDSVVREAHPAIKKLSCAMSHPKMVSCSEAYLRYVFRQFGNYSKLFFPLYATTVLMKLRSVGPSLEVFSGLVRKTLKSSTFATLSVASAWSAICFLQQVVPRQLLNSNLFYISGFLGGLMAFIDRESAHPLFLDAARSAGISWWKARRKSRYFRRIPCPEVFFFMLSIGVLNFLYDSQPTTITSKGARKFIQLLRGTAKQGKISTPDCSVDTDAPSNGDPIPLSALSSSFSK